MKILVYDADEYDTITETERIEMYRAWTEHREKLRMGARSTE